MATIVNNPGGGESNGVASVLIGVILIAVLIVLFYVFGLPAMRNTTPADTNKSEINVELPDPSPAPEPSPAPTPNPAP